MSVEDLLTWEPYCGHVSGGVVCDRNAHDDDTPHRNSETGFTWW